MTIPIEKQLGTQLVLEPTDIGPPDYELRDWEVEETIELLLEKAVELGERSSQATMAAGRGPAPHAHRANTYYHAIEAIRFYQAKATALQDRLDLLLLERNGDNS